MMQMSNQMENAHEQVPVAEQKPFPLHVLAAMQNVAQSFPPATVE
jgi:hypothetical protein